MQANEFEKEVKERMDELQLYPSAGVWPEVEKRIRKEKKRRWIIFWWLLPLLLAGGAGTWYLLNDKNKKEIVKQENILTNPEGQNERNNDKQSSMVSGSSKAVTPPEDQTGDLKTNQSETEANTSSARQQSIKKRNEIVIKTAPGSRRRTGKPLVTQPAIKALPTGDNKTVAANPVAVIDKPVNNNDNISSLADKANDVPAVAKTNDDNAPLKDSVVTAVSIKKDKNFVMPMTVSSEQLQDKQDKKKDKDKDKNKWETGLIFTAGSSSRVNGDLSIGSNKRADSYANSPGGGGSLVVQPPGQFGGGVHLQAGFYAKKNIGKKTAFSTGFLVSANSILQQVGTYYSSNALSLGNDPRFASGYYSGGSIAAVANRYTLIGTPLSLHWQLNKSKKVPLVWENGFTPGFILLSKNFVYDAGNNITYQDNKAVHRFQFSYSTGLYAKFRNASAHPFSVGLTASYHFTDLQKITSDNRNKLLLAGIRIGWTIKK